MTLALLHFLALSYLVVGIAMLLKPAAVKAGIDDLLSLKGLMFAMGVLSIFIGAAIVTWHNTWDGLAEIIVSLMGWAALIKGVMFLAFPGELTGMAKKFYKTDTCIRTWGVIVLVVGALLMAWAKGLF